MSTPAKRTRSRSRTGWLVALVLAIVAGAALLAGCGGSNDTGVARASGDTTATTSTTTTGTSTGTVDRETALLAFSKCMRTDGGIPDYPDPQVGSDGRLQLPRPGQGINVEQFRDGIGKCRQHLAGVINTSPEARTDLRDAQLEVAKCLRGEGLDVPDPDPNQAGPGVFGSLDRNDPKVAAALEKCGPIFQRALQRAQGGS